MPDEEGFVSFSIVEKSTCVICIAVDDCGEIGLSSFTNYGVVFAKCLFMDQIV